jgi:aspartyl-tRNA(Asn)/glutamyl-tRNA(Gln) amidotransferase subunit A
MELTDLTARALADGYKAKQFSVPEVVSAYLARIDAENPKLNAYLEVFADALPAAGVAQERIARGTAHPLTGVPIAVKDNILINGKRVSAASKMLENYTATYDATAIKKLKDVGVVFLGRTNMDEFAMGSSTEHSAFGPTRNPHDTARVPGGSSGGSAAAVAAHLAPIALGSETCGSIRQPASLCGLVGFKPTYGAVSRSGLIAMGSSLDQIGPFARTVADAELVFNTIRGRDPLDGTTLEDYSDGVAKNKKIGVPRSFVNDAQPETKVVFEKKLAELAGKGYDIVDIELPSAPYALPAYYIVMPAEVSTNLARLDGMRYGHHVDGMNLLDEYKKSRAEGFGPETRRRIILGTYILSSGYYDAYYRRATALRSIIAADLARAYETVSYIATPTAPGPAFKIGEKADPVSMYLEDIFSAPANLAGLPSISVPMGTVARDGKDLPVGIQFMTPKRTDATLFSVARDTLGEA